jgi:hypothetical protein
VANHESLALRWVPVSEVDALPLHPGFALTWPQVRPRVSVLLVDTANVVGARPDGWWRDRERAASRVLGALATLRSSTLLGPVGEPRVVGAVVAVLEGAAVAAGDPDWVVVHRTPHGAGGDDVLVDVAGQLLADGHDVLGVSADRGLQARWAALARTEGAGRITPAGPRWLLDLMDAPTGP